MITREAHRQTRRPISGPVQLEIAVEAFRDVSAQAACLSTSTAQERSYADGYKRALSDFTREVEERQQTLARWRKVVPIQWLRKPESPADEKEEGYACAACAKRLTLESAQRAAQLWSFSLDHPDARRLVQEFWARAGAHAQARHAT